MYYRFFILTSSIVFGLVVPILEISTSHVFNPDWPGHARMHDVWQLGSNILFSIFAVWLLVAKKDVLLASVINFFVVAPFTVAYIIRGAYGGDMLYADGTELLIAGVNPVFGISAFLTLGLGLTIYRSYNVWRDTSPFRAVQQNLKK